MKLPVLITIFLLSTSLTVSASSESKNCPEQLSELCGPQVKEQFFMPKDVLSCQQFTINWDDSFSGATKDMSVIQFEITNMIHGQDFRKFTSSNIGNLMAIIATEQGVIFSILPDNVPVESYQNNSLLSFATIKSPLSEFFQISNIDLAKHGHDFCSA